MMTVNVKSALYGMQAIAPHFIARGRGQIVNVSSMLSRVPFATFRSAYNAAKAALNALTANARVDLARAHPGIQVTLVMPGLVRTEFQQQRPRRIAADAAGARRSRSRTPPRRSSPRSSIRSPRSTPTRVTPPPSCSATFRMSAPSSVRPPREDDARCSTSDTPRTASPCSR